MSEPWMTYLAVFVLVTVATHLAQAGLSGLLGQRRRTGARLGALVGADIDASEADLRRTARAGSSPLTRWLTRQVLQSGTTLSPLALLGIGLALALISFVLLPAPQNAWFRLVLALIAAGLVILGSLRIARARRIARFGEALPDVLDIITRSLRAGHPLQVSLALVARETPAPAGPEFALLIDEVSYGRSVSEALENLYQRVGYPELRFVVAAVTIGHQTGGNLGEILSRLSRTLRERQRLTRRVRALSAEGRFSGVALSILPIALFGLINLLSPSYYAEFWASPASGKVLAVAVILLALGNLVILRLVKLKV